jgi:putative membrane protein
MALVFLYSTLIVYLVKYVPHFQGVEAKDITSASSIVIGLIFAFRINSAYDRWWEARKLWGQLVNEVRNLCIKFDLYFDVTEEEKAEFGLLLIAFAYSLKDHLRGIRTDLQSLGINVETEKQARLHLPLLTSSMIFQFVQSKRAGASHEFFDFVLMDRHLSALMDVCGACERILTTPVASWFQASIWMWLVVYLAILPWLLADEFHFTAIVIVLFAGYFGVALELLAEEIQEPFGFAVNDLPTDKFCATISASVCQILHTVPTNSPQAKPSTLP